MKHSRGRRGGLGWTVSVLGNYARAQVESMIYIHWIHLHLLRYSFHSSQCSPPANTTLCSSLQKWKPTACIAWKTSCPRSQICPPISGEPPFLPIVPCQHGSISILAKSSAFHFPFPFKLDTLHDPVAHDSRSFLAFSSTVFIWEYRSLFSPSQRLPFGKTYLCRSRTQGTNDWKVVVKPVVASLNLFSSTTNPLLISASSPVVA